jgi:ubiquinone biosynthesis protein
MFEIISFLTLNDHQPLASASVGQVHAAVLQDGQPVVIKIQKPAARAQVTANLDIVLRLARRLQASTTWGRSLGVMALAGGGQPSRRAGSPGGLPRIVRRSC